MVDDFAADPDYRLLWPREVFASELARLIGRAELDGVDEAWRRSISQLLRQAFESAAPAERFEMMRSFDEEEPF